MTEDDIRTLVDDPARRRDVTAAELADAMLERLEAAQPRLHAMITITPELALADARRADHARDRGERLALDGMPVVVKDVIDVAGARTTAGSRLFVHRVSEEDAEVTRRLRGAGAVILGKANLHELAFGATSRNEAFGHVGNPWGREVLPGGSSGGSGAAVAADLCVAAIGTDTGGSVRIPASCCGVAGIRPTYGAVSNRGVLPVSPTLDTVGPLARSAHDLAALLDVMAGWDPDDPRSLPCTLEPGSLRGPPLAAIRIGRPHPFFFDALDDEVGAAVASAAETLSGLGAQLVDVELRGGHDAAEACGPIIWADALAVHRDHLAASPELLEEGTRRRLALAEGLTAADLARLLQRMYEWQRSARQVFDRVDLLLTPTLPLPPPAREGADTIETTARFVPLTFAFALARVPSLSLPCGFTGLGHPIGAQLVAPWWRDRLLLRVGAGYQAATDWHRRRPPSYDAASTRTTS